MPCARYFNPPGGAASASVMRARPYSGNNLRALRATFFTFFAALLAAFLALPILDFALLAIDPSRSLCFTFYVVGAIPHLYLCDWPSKTFEMML